MFRKSSISFEGRQSIICVGKEPYLFWKVHFRTAELKPLASATRGVAIQHSNLYDVSSMHLVLLKCHHFLVRINRDL